MEHLPVAEADPTWRAHVYRRCSSPRNPNLTKIVGNFVTGSDARVTY
jgi:hypothetical protein